MTAQVLGIPQAPADSAVVDTIVAADTLTIVQRLRADSTLFNLSDPTQLGSFFDRILATLLDPTLWIGMIGIILNILVILLLSWGLIRLVDRMTDRWTRRFESLGVLHPRRQRSHTLSNLISSTARYIIWPIGIIMVLSEINIDVGALLATAGIAGLAIGFGAQTLVKDVISGIFLLFDDTLHTGDQVRIGDDAGTVEHIGIRLIKVRKFSGELLMVPAGELRMFGNRSIGFCRVIVNIGLAYEQNIDDILPVMDRVAREWAAERKSILLEEAPTVQAITDFLDSSVSTRIIVQVVPGEQWQAERELRVRIKREFDRLGIEIPFPRQTSYERFEIKPPYNLSRPDTTDSTDEPPGYESD